MEHITLVILPALIKLFLFHSPWNLRLLLTLLTFSVKYLLFSYYISAQKWGVRSISESIKKYQIRGITSFNWLSYLGCITLVILPALKKLFLFHSSWNLRLLLTLLRFSVKSLLSFSYISARWGGGGSISESVKKYQIRGVALIG